MVKTSRGTFLSTVNEFTLYEEKYSLVFLKIEQSPLVDAEFKI